MLLFSIYVYFLYEDINCIAGSTAGYSFRYTYLHYTLQYNKYSLYLIAIIIRTIFVINQLYL